MSGVRPSYSPAWIVLPCYKTDRMHDQQATATAMQEVRPWLSRLDCCVIGPGLGRDGVLKGVADLMNAAEVRSTSTIVDADGLFLVAQDPELVEGRSDCVLTPNRRELERLAARLNVAAEADDVAAQVARKLGNVVVVAKGQRRGGLAEAVDVMPVDEPGAPKRCGGLGDVLCGALAPLRGVVGGARGLPPRASARCWKTAAPLGVLRRVRREPARGGRGLRAQEARDDGTSSFTAGNWWCGERVERRAAVAVLRAAVDAEGLLGRSF